MVALAEFPNLPDIPLMQPRKAGTRKMPAKANRANGSQTVAEAMVNDLDLPMERPSGVEEGSRDDTLFRWACSLFARGYTRDEVLADCLECNRTFHPPLDETTVLTKVESAAKYETKLVDPLTQNRLATEPTSQPTTHPAGTRRSDYKADLGNARRLVKKFGSKIRYLSDAKVWMWWDESKWIIDGDGMMMRLAKYTMELMLQEAIKITESDERKRQAGHAFKSMQKPRLEAMISLASTESEVVFRANQLDADPWLVGVRNGVIELKTMAFRPAKRGDFITKQLGVAYDPSATCPHWLEFLGLIFAKDREVIAYVQRAVGYTLTGSVAEEIMFIPWGRGLNGKTVFCSMLYDLMGDYAIVGDVDVIVERKNPGGPTPELMRLKGSRLVSINETQENEKLSERRVKYITSNEMISARNLYEGIVDFMPTHKTWLRTNHKPIIAGTDIAIWRRVGLIPFLVNILETLAHEGKKIDTHFREHHLVPELPGLLNWALEGVRMYVQEGLSPPKTVQAAVAEYRKAMDVVAQWIDDHCEIDPQGFVYTADAYANYAAWAQTEAKYQVSKNRFGRVMHERFGGGENDRENGRRVYRGFKIKELKPETVLEGARPATRASRVGGLEATVRPGFTNKGLQ